MIVVQSVFLFSVIHYLHTTRMYIKHRRMYVGVIVFSFFFIYNLKAMPSYIVIIMNSHENNEFLYGKRDFISSHYFENSGKPSKLRFGCTQLSANVMKRTRKRFFSSQL